MQNNIIVFDCEIENLILGHGEEKKPGYHYCKGWKDFPGMGISVIGVFDYLENRYRVFMRDNFNQFQALINRADIIVGFNSLNFDNVLCLANQIEIPEEKSFDIMAEVIMSAGLDEQDTDKHHNGYSLNALAKANLDGLGKTGSGAIAPELWQRGNIGTVVDYCLSDIFLTKCLTDGIINQNGLWSPVYTNVWHDFDLKPGTSTRRSA